MYLCKQVHGFSVFLRVCNLDCNCCLSNKYTYMQLRSPEVTRVNFHLSPSNYIFKFADDTTVLGLISNNDEAAYRQEVGNLAVWCSEHNLNLNLKKTKEMII